MLFLHVQRNLKCVILWFISAKRVKLSKRKTKLRASDGESPADSDDSHENESNEENEPSESKQVEAGAGWADAMAKILCNETPQEESKVVLSKSKEYAKKKAEETKQMLEQKKEVGY